ncbi:MAG TPA: hypothetical protein VIS51_04315 [Solirubrobacterales bacterium]
MKIRFETVRKMELHEFHVLELTPEDLHDTTLDNAITQALANGTTHVSDSRQGDIVGDYEIEYDSIDETAE